MSEEEAVEICKNIIKQNNEIVKQTRKNKDTNAMQLTANCDNESIAIETLLKSREKDKAELEKKDKIIDEMANSFEEEGFYSEYCQALIDNNICPDDCDKCIKQYFKSKAEKE